jgi:hypothetical protein
MHELLEDVGSANVCEIEIRWDMRPVTVLCSVASMARNDIIAWGPVSTYFTKSAGLPRVRRMPCMLWC